MAKLLISDDDPQVLELVSLVLEGAGYTVVTTSDPRAVFPLAAGSDIDAIILDVDMPVSGFEVLNELRSDESTASLPILFLSGLAEGPDRVRGLREGADDYLAKPFEPAELVLRVERLISWRARSGPARGAGDRSAAAPPRVPASGPRPGERRAAASRTAASRTAASRTAASRTAASRSAPKRFGRYQVLGVIGQGSMGTVYRGWDPRLERPVALKTIRLESAGRDSQHRLELLDRLRREAVTIARFSQPNIIAVYDMGSDEDTAYIAMQLVDGLTLRDCLRRRGPLPAERTVPLAACVARGLEAAHAGQVIHRDVKPGNVLLGRDGAIKVTDFGLSFVLSAMAHDSAEISGTPGYVPPEVMNQRPYTEAGDLFGLGATLYQILTDVHPLAGPTLRDTIMNTLRGNIQPLTEHVSDIPPALAELVMRLLAIDPDQRPSAGQVAERMEHTAVESGYHWTPDCLPE